MGKFLHISTNLANTDTFFSRYDSGRDWLTGNATVSGGTRSPITNQTYSTTSILLPGYLTANSSRGVNHGLVIDGKVAVWTVRKTGNNTVASSSKSGFVFVLHTRFHW